uniref:Aspartate beta-hydroxylase n=1 Tax=Cynoglossus semilaevis TaxID=244447 RepID=A0A3P8WG01_CYNSE
VVLALLGVWSSVAVLYFDIVDYDRVIGKLKAYDSDGDGDFDIEDAKVLLGEFTLSIKAERQRVEMESLCKEMMIREERERLLQERMEHVEENKSVAEEKIGMEEERQESAGMAEEGRRIANEETQKNELITEQERVEKEIIEKVEPELERREQEENAMENERIDKEGIEKEMQEEEIIIKERAQMEKVDLDHITEEKEVKEQQESQQLDEIKEGEERERFVQEKHEVEKKKKPKLLNKLDKTIKAEIDAAEKLRKKGKVEEALKAFELLIQQNPQSPRARFGKAQAEDDLAEKLRSNDMLLRAINSYREAADLPDVSPDLLRAALKRRSERQQFLGRMRASVATLERLVHAFPDDVSLKNDLGVAHLLLGDNTGAKKVYEQVSTAPHNGFAKVHYGFILKSENKIEESIPYLKEGLESGEPGTDDGRFYFHLGDALQRVGDNSAYHWYELGHQRGHFASVWQRSLYNVDGLRAQPWWTAKETGYTDLVKVLEKNWRTIRDEALSVMDQNTGMFVPEEENLREKGEWGQYTLWQQGRKVGNACQGVPKTCALLERHPEATGCKRGQIKFSVMQPGTHVWPHTGPTNCRLRMHLGLVVPKQGCRIRCTDQIREWEEGKVLIFDDSFEHEVWQDADSYRLIFIVDVWHPELTHNQRQTLSPI